MRRRSLAVFLVTALAPLPLLAIDASVTEESTRDTSPPLWEGTNLTVHARDEAVLHGVEYLYARGMQDDINFFTYGFDYLLCLQAVSHRALSPVLQQRAQDVGRALGRECAGLHTARAHACQHQWPVPRVSAAALCACARAGKEGGEARSAAQP